ncbi:MAG TPA: pyridoxamine 5'-phosphate oxidase family protein [bacterium]|nr:pyridoxamine 5'-phosphate oxidase family protein [bacterium]
MNFSEIFDEFIAHSKDLKVLHVASCDSRGKPNSAPKMLVDILHPNQVLYLDYKFTQTYANITKNNLISISFMDDRAFKGFRLTGRCEIVESGKEFDNARQRWERRLTAYEAERLIERSKGLFSERHAESALPKDFVIIKLVATEAAVVRPDRVLRALQKNNSKKPS